MRRLAVPLGLGAVFVEFLGFQWDLAWHGDLGRDTFFTAPHLVIVAGLVTGLAVGLRVVAADGIRGRPGMTLLAAGSAMTGASLALDNWFHQQFGVDVSVWSPPHLLFFLTVSLGVVGVLADYVRDPRARPIGFALMAGLLIAGLMTAGAEYELGFPHFAMIWSPLVLAGVFALGAALTAGVTGLRWAATASVTTALLIRAVGIGFNAVAGRSLPVPPAGMLAGAVAFDLARRRFRPSVAAAIGWAVTFAVEVPLLRTVGKTWWVPDILVPGFLGGVAVAVAMAALGRAIGAMACGTERARFALAPALLFVAAVGLSGWGHLSAPRTYRPATYASSGHSVSLTVPHGSDRDWVSLFGPARASGLFAHSRAPAAGGGFADFFLPQVQGPRLRAIARIPPVHLSWLGGLEHRGGAFRGTVKGDGEWMTLWYVEGNHVFAGIIERGSAGSIALVRQAGRPLLPPPPWAASVGIALAMGITVLALGLAPWALSGQARRNDANVGLDGAPSRGQSGTAYQLGGNSNATVGGPSSGHAARAHPGDRPGGGSVLQSRRR